jgi:hypothetical protein
MKLLILFIFLFKINAYAQNQVVPLPPAVSSIDDIIGEFRETLSLKLEELGKNFISTMGQSTILFTNSDSIRCNGSLIQQGQPVSSLLLTFKNKTESELSEKAVYTGCHSQISLVEDVITKGTKLIPLSFKDFIKGHRSFDLNENETSRLYRLSNAENEDIFKLIIEKTKKGKIAEFYILDSKFLTITYEFEETYTRATFMYHGYKGKYVRKHSTWEFDRLYEPFSNTVLAKKGKSTETFFFDTRGGRLSQSEFLSRVEMYLFSGPISRIRNFLEYHNNYFPTTNIVQSGRGNERLKEELRILFNRLQNNTEINLVKRQVQDYMEAAESGLLKDNRPEE